MSLAKILAHWLILPPGCLVVALGLACVVAWRTSSRLRHVLAILCLVLFGLSTRPGAALLCRPLESAFPVPAAIEADVLVMLGAGSTGGVPDIDGTGQPSAIMAKNMLAAFRLQRQTGLPLVLSGGEVREGQGCEAAIARRILVGMGIPEERIVVEGASRTTAENARFTGAIMQARGWRRALVVCPALHAARARALFRAEGVDCRIWPSHHRMSQGLSFSPARDLVPSAAQLANSAAALKEYLGLAALELGLR